MLKFGIKKTAVTRAAAVPGVPVVTLLGVTYSTASLKWTGSSGKYSIVGATGDTYSAGITFAKNLTPAQATVRLPRAGPYSLKVIASAGGTYTSASNTVVAVVPYKPPTVPVIKSAKIGYVNGVPGVTLAWSASASNTTIYYSADAGLKMNGRGFAVEDIVSNNQFSIFSDQEFFYGTTGLSSFVYVPPGQTFSVNVTAYIPGTTYEASSTARSIRVPPPIKPSAPVLTVSEVTFTGAKLNWTGQTVRQPVANAVAYDIYIDDGVVETPLVQGITGLSSTIQLDAGGYTLYAVANGGRGFTFSESNRVPVTIPYQKPSVPVISQPVVGVGKVNVSWSAATGNSPITYDLISLPAGVTYASDIEDIEFAIPGASFASYSQYPLQVIARAGPTFSTSAGATLRFTPPPPDEILVNYLSKRGCQLTWNPSSINTGLSYSISELTDADFSVVQGPTFDVQTGLWIAGVTFGTSDTYDFFVSGLGAGATGLSSEIVVNVPTDPKPVVDVYYQSQIITIPPGYVAMQAQLVGGGGGGALYGGGGGGGGYAAGFTYVSSGSTFAVEIGRGGRSGAGTSIDGEPGEASSVAGITAYGGLGGLSGSSGGSGGSYVGGNYGLQGKSGQEDMLQGTIAAGGIPGHDGFLGSAGNGGQGGGTFSGSAFSGVSGVAFITFFPL
jgi:hypothetical protein